MIEGGGGEAKGLPMKIVVRRYKARETHKTAIRTTGSLKVDAEVYVGDPDTAKGEKIIRVPP